MSERFETYEDRQPWVIYVYGLTTDRWWPLWRSTRVLGYAKIECQCCICGDRTVVKVKLPRVGVVVDRGPHALRREYLAKHQHPNQRTAPETWVWPLRNPEALRADDLMDILGDAVAKASAPSPASTDPSNPYGGTQT